MGAAIYICCKFLRYLVFKEIQERLRKVNFLKWKVLFYPPGLQKRNYKTYNKACKISDPKLPSSKQEAKKQLNTH